MKLLLVCGVPLLPPLGVLLVTSLALGIADSLKKLYLAGVNRPPDASSSVDTSNQIEDLSQSFCL